MTPPHTPLTKCSYLTPDKKLNFDAFCSDDIDVIFSEIGKVTKAKGIQNMLCTT